MKNINTEDAGDPQRTQRSDSHPKPGTPPPFQNQEHARLPAVDFGGAGPQAVIEDTSTFGEIISNPQPLDSPRPLDKLGVTLRSAQAARGKSAIRNSIVDSRSPSISYDAFSRHFSSAPPGKLYLLYGDPVVFRFALALASCALSRGTPVAVVDGCNRFDAHSIARFAREHGESPDRFLNSIFISRGFTCYQMEAAVNDRLQPFLDRIGGNVAMIFGLLDTFYDEQAPLPEVRNILRRMMMRLDEMKSAGISILLASRFWNVGEPGRNALFPALSSGMDAVCRVELNEEMKPKLTLEQPGKALFHGTDSTDVHQPDRRGNRKLVEIPPRTPRRGPGSIR